MHSRIHSHSVRHLGFKPEVARAFNECSLTVLEKYKKSASLLLCTVWIHCARPSQEADRLQCLYFLPCINLILPAIAPPRVSYATRSSRHARLDAYSSVRQVRNVYAQYAGIRTKVFGGVETMDDKGTVLKNIEECSDIVIGLPGRIKALVDFGVLKLRVTRRFVHSLWKEIPRSAQVMSFSSTLDIRARKWCKGLMVKPRRYSSTTKQDHLPGDLAPLRQAYRS